MSRIEVASVPEGVCHRPCVVGVNLNKVGPGKLTATVKVGDRDVAHSVRQNGNNPNMWEVVFHPIHAAPHRLRLFYNGVPRAEVLEVPVKSEKKDLVDNCNIFTPLISELDPSTEPWAGGLGLYQAKVGRVNSFHIDTLGKPASQFDVVVSSPTGSALPVRCYQTKTGKLQAEFSAREPGPHQIEVLQQAKPLAGSPYICEAFEPESVRIVDIPHTQGNVGERIMFTGKYLSKDKYYSAH